MLAWGSCEDGPPPLQIHNGLVLLALLNMAEIQLNCLIGVGHHKRARMPEGLDCGIGTSAQTSVMHKGKELMFRSSPPSSDGFLRVPNTRNPLSHKAASIALRIPDGTPVTKATFCQLMSSLRFVGQIYAQPDAKDRPSVSRQSRLTLGVSEYD